MGGRAAGAMRVWRKWTVYHEDIAKKRWKQMSRDHLSYACKEEERQKAAFAYLMFGICHAFTLHLHILNRSQLGLGNSGRVKDTQNLIPEGMNSRGTNAQPNKFLHGYNSEVVIVAKGVEKNNFKYGEVRDECDTCQHNVGHWVPVIISSACVLIKKQIS